jgi:NADH:ubiquinone reductase (H+-translocating)
MAGEPNGPHRVIVVGGGFAGLLATRVLARVRVDITLIDRSTNHVFQPLLYQFATGILSEGQIAPPLRAVVHRHKNVRVLMAEVTGFDLEQRSVAARRPDGESIVLRYDTLIVATGCGQSYFGHDEFARFAPGMKTINDALEIRRRVFGAFEAAETATDPDERQAWLTFAVVGGGPTGVELAGQIRELASRTLSDEFRSIDPRDCRVVLFDGGKEPLATFGDQLSARAVQALEKLGVELRMSSIVTHIDDDGVQARVSDGTVVPLAARTVIWTAGVEASPLAGLLAEATGAETDRVGRVKVLQDCTLPGHPEVFTLGDMMNLDNLPGVAEVALQSGLHAARTVHRRVKGDHEAKPFQYRDMGSMAYLSRGRAIVDFHGLKLSGWLGWLMWLVVHITFLTSFGNRVTTLFTWGSAFAGRRRSQRALTLRDFRAAAVVPTAAAAVEPRQRRQAAS